jgi:hypothetical protein
LFSVSGIKHTTNLHELGGTVGGLIAVTWKPDLNKCLFQNDQHSVAVLTMTIIREREIERERENRLACRAFSSLPTIRDIMGLVMGIPVRA